MQKIILAIMINSNVQVGFERDTRNQAQFPIRRHLRPQKEVLGKSTSKNYPDPLGLQDFKII